ncbi:Mechanosensitive ion channel-domain-containing protein [Dichotomopilus funicola]|uniref:Mechanosensitive ion channel-domain-containing protein n=1 Tax=Dichotomopilus funicola TaxID=1934379 RepID=A0AAN6ZM01_9PEZI|nr:Mechanosensitive ion channel-domain-containing protein [Dichotomopilus funicola]
MSLRSTRSPGNRGFVQISGGANSTEMQDIPLRTIKSNASSTGTRRVNAENMDEKHALFHKAVGGPAGRRRVRGDLQRSNSDGSDEASLNAMGRLYNKIVGFSVLTRYLVYVVPVVLLLAVPIIVLPLTGDKDRVSLGDGHRHSLFLLFVWFEVSWLALWAGKMVAHILPFIFMFFCGVISSGTRKYATVLRALEIPLSLFFWGLASWLSFKFMWDGANRSWSDVIVRILLSLFISSAVLLGEKFLVQLISISYHQRSFANRIHDSKREIFLLGLMYEASRTLFPMYCPEFAEEDYVINDSIEVMLARNKASGKQGVAAAPMRLVGDVGRFGDKITSVFGNIASEITGKQVFNPNSAHSIVVEALEKVRSSEAMARRIWMSFVVEGQEALSMDDIIEVMGPAHREEAEECFNAIDADQNGDISLDEMIRKVVETGKERKAIAHSMKDISQALAVFDKVLLFVVLIIVIIIFLAVFQSSFIATLTTAGTTLLSLSFVFAVTTQEFLGSCIFLFVKHPYDVGDRVDIVGPEKEQLIVEKISLLYTVFTRIDKMQVVQVPNIVLNNAWVENVTRSKAMKEVIDVNVSFDTSFEDIELLRLELEQFVRAPENNRDFQPDIAIGVGGVGDCDKLTLKIAIKHKSNWHNDAVRATRRSKFMCALTLALRRVPINAPGGGGDALGGPANPAYSVAVTDEYAANARAESEKTKTAKKLANQSAEESATADEAAAAEQRAADQINTRNAVVEALDDWGYDNTLTFSTSRDPSSDRRQPSDVGSGSGGANLAHSASRRSNILSGSSTNLGARESQRGRRPAGETLPPHALNEDPSLPGVHLTQSTSSNRPGGGKRSFDVERQAGMSSPPPAGASAPTGAWGTYNPYVQGPTPIDTTVQQHQQQPGTYPGGVTSPTLTSPTHLQPGSPPPGAGGRPLVGARQRGTSVSHPQQQGGSSQGQVGPTGPGGAGRI